MSYGWWMDKHTRHHANPNHEDRDPDVAPDLLVWSHAPGRREQGIARLHRPASGRSVLPAADAGGRQPPRVECPSAAASPASAAAGSRPSCCIVHFAIYLALLFTLLSPLHALAFIVIHQAVFGVYLGATFAPNHKGMPMLDRGRRARLPPQAGADLPQRERRPGAQRRAGRPEPPDRAPPVPEHAVGEPHEGAADRARVLRARSASPTTRAACSRRTAWPWFTCTAPERRCARTDARRPQTTRNSRYRSVARVPAARAAWSLVS